MWVNLQIPYTFDFFVISFVGSKGVILVVAEYKDWHTDRINHYGFMFTEVTCVVARTMIVLERVIAVPCWQRFALYSCRIIVEPSLSISSWMYWCCHWCIDLLMYQLVLNIDTIVTVIENQHIHYFEEQYSIVLNNCNMLSNGNIYILLWMMYWTYWTDWVPNREVTRSME